MKVSVLVAALALAAAGAALAQTKTPPVPGGASGGGSGGTIGSLLNDGYDIKAAFVNANVSYVFLQKGTSAFMCKSVSGSACEKLN